jgi:hypothetical protein
LLDDSCNFFAWLLWFQALLDPFFFLKAYSNIEIFLAVTYIFFPLAKLKRNIRFQHKLVTLFIQGLMTTLDNVMMIELDFVGG